MLSNSPFYLKVWNCYKPMLITCNINRRKKNRTNAVDIKAKGKAERTILYLIINGVVGLLGRF